MFAIVIHDLGRDLGALVVDDAVGPATVLFDDLAGDPAYLINLLPAFNTQRGQIDKEDVLPGVKDEAISKQHLVDGGKAGS